MGRVWPTAWHIPNTAVSGRTLVWALLTTRGVPCPLGTLVAVAWMLHQGLSKPCPPRPAAGLCERPSHKASASLTPGQDLPSSFCPEYFAPCGQSATQRTSGV